MKKVGKASRLPKTQKGTQLVVIGNGMVGYRFCKSLVERGLHQTCQITVIGAEPLPAYDRISLSSYVDSRSEDALLLAPAQWYEDHNIILHLGEEVSEIKTESKEILSTTGNRFSYDKLILATGSRAFAPPIGGVTGEGIILYRSIADIKAIVAAAHGKQHATVIGGGLLGLEAAQAVQKLGLKASVIHLGSHLMSAQLNPAAAAVLEEEVRAQEIEVLLKANTTHITPQGEGLELKMEDGRTLQTGLVIVAAGIRSNSALAEQAGIRCGVRGGIIVDNHLQTSDPHVFAVGECALFEGKIFGLAAPGYAMADHLAGRLASQKLLPLPSPDLSTKLKMVGVDVTTIGNPLDKGVLYEFKGDKLYRALILSPKGQLLGGLGVGDWPESSRVQSLYRDGAFITEKERDYFTSEGILREGGGSSSVHQWDDKRIVCNCMEVTKGEIVACFKTCGRDPDAIAKETSCSEVCGSCRPLLEELCEVVVTSPKKAVGMRSLLALSVAAFLGVVALLIFPPAPIADSVESWYYQVDKLWRDNFIKQITGYTILALFAVGLLLSLRKRLRWFRFGHFNHWRVFHTVFGITSLVALFAHTGFHFGDNLNYWLMLTFVLLNLFGAVAGIFSAVESSGTSGLALFARRYRPFLTYLHLVLFWPLPVLLGFHIASVYLY